MEKDDADSKSDGSKAPRFVKHLKSAVVKDGDKVTLEATIRGSSKFEVVWLQNGKELKQNKDFKASSDGDLHKLEIAEIYPEDSGMYTCEAFNDAGECFSTCTLTVLVPEETLKGPRFSIYPRSATFAEGQEATIRLVGENCRFLLFILLHRRAFCACVCVSRDNLNLKLACMRKGRQRRISRRSLCRRAQIQVFKRSRPIISDDREGPDSLEMDQGRKRVQARRAAQGRQGRT